MNDPLWFKSATFYEVYVRAFFDSNGDGHGDLPGLTQKLDYLQDLGVDCLWLLPIYPSPLRDDGYDISNYYDIYPSYGSLDDFRKFLDAAHARGMRVIADLVVNHTSDQHPWFQAARSDSSSPYHDYYVWSDTDEKYKDARIIFIDTEKSNWTWDEEAGKYFWHRFYSTQPDLNYDNPAVQQEMLNVMKFWLDLGVDGFRADAVPYLFEREGTNCENLPVTHEYLKEMRRFINDQYPDRVLLAEANQWPKDVLPYFGEGSDEFHMGFHFPLMPRIFMALKREDRSPMVWILEQTPPLTESTQWCIFLRNHDELTLEMVTEEERQWMWEQYAPHPRMRLNLGIRRRLAPLLDNDRCKIALAYSLLFTMPGSPIIYYGDEIGMGDNIWIKDRDGVRTPMQWDDSPNAGFSTADPDQLYIPVVDDPAFGYPQVNVEAQRTDPNSIFNMVRNMIAVRKQHKIFGWGTFEWVFGEPPGDSLAVTAYMRSTGTERLLIVHNLSASPQSVVLRPPEVLAATPVDILSGKTFPQMEYNRLPLDLEPYEYLWLKM
jgi:maltose alpha-D-glucosyltransferase/alpha-amylase